MSVSVWHDKGFETRLEQLPYGQMSISVSSRDGRRFVAVPRCRTGYPITLVRLIYEVKGAAWLCDEIVREEDPTRAGRLLRKVALSYLEESAFSSGRLLDFGCGAGASTMNLARLFSASSVIGTDVDRDLLRIASARASHYSYGNVSFVPSLDPMHIPVMGQEFDFVFLFAVLEHLLPAERLSLLPELWAILRPGGFMFVLETPNRWWPIEGHTTGMPLINYMPSFLARLLATNCCRKIDRHETWPDLLRKGIRGGSVRGLARILRERRGRCPSS